MTGYVRVDTSNNIADGNVISAADLDNEFDGVQAGFNASTGHTHGGSAGEGAPITKLGPTQDVTASASLLAPKTTNTVDVGSSLLKFKDLWLAGNASVAGTLGVTGVATLTAQPILSSLTASQAVFTDASKGLVSNAITGTGSVVMSASPTLTGTVNVAGLTASNSVTLSGGTANGVTYLNGSKVLTSGSALTFDGTTLVVTKPTAYNTRFAYDAPATYYTDIGYAGTNTVAPSNPFYYFSLAGSEQMRLTSTGLGIGTSSPSTKLQSAKDAALTSTWDAAQLWLTGATSTAYRLQIGYDTTNNYSVIQSVQGGVAFTNLLLNPLGGNVGIGTSSPTGKLSVAGSTGTVSIPTNGVQLAFSYGGANYIGTTTAGGSLVFQTGASSTAATLDSSGNLGIGTSSPSQKLSVTGNGGFTGWVGATGGGSGLRVDGVLMADRDQDNNVTLIGGSDNTLRLRTGSTTRATLDSSGNLGIGTSSPAGRVHAVNTYTNTSDATMIAAGNIPGINLRATAGARMSMFSNYATADSTSFLTGTGGANPSSEVLRFDHSNGNVLVPTGNLGLGVTPSAWNTGKALEINAVGTGLWGAFGNTYLNANNYYNAADKFAGTGYAVRYLQVPSNGQHQWLVSTASGTAGNAITFTQAMTLDASGNLLIGRTSPSISGVKVDAEGLFGSIKSGNWSWSFGASASTNAFVINDTTSGSSVERARIDSSGNLLVGTTSYFGGTARLSITATAAAQNVLQTRPTTDITYYPGIFENSSGTTVGYIQSTNTATSYVTSSDYRLKEAIAPMTGALAKVALLKPCTYKWKVDGSDGQGFVAHELAEVCPAAVSGKKDAVDAEGNPQYQGIDVSFLVGTLTAAIQELNAKFEAYKASHP